MDAIFIRTLATWGLALCLATSVMAGDGKPTVDIKTVTLAKATLIDLEAKDRPVADLLEEIARKMGYEKIVVKEKATEGLKYSCRFEKKPAWECLLEVLDKNNLDFGGADIGEDYALGIYPASTPPTHCRVAGGFVACFSQKPTGTTGEFPHYHPFSLSILAEPSLSWQFTEAAVTEQIGSGRKPCDLLALQLFAGAPLANWGKDANSPWPGIFSFKVKAVVEVARKKVVATLGIGDAPRPVEHEGKELFTLESVKQEGHLVRVRVAFPCAEKGMSASQGGWGTAIAPGFERQTGVRFEFVGADGAQLSPVMSWEGDGTRAQAGFGFSGGELRQAGGIDAVKLVFSKTLEKDTDTINFEFKNLLGLDAK